MNHLVQLQIAYSFEIVVICFVAKIIVTFHNLKDMLFHIVTHNLILAFTWHKHHMEGL